MLRQEFLRGCPFPSDPPRREPALSAAAFAGTVTLCSSDPPGGRAIPRARRRPGAVITAGSEDTVRPNPPVRKNGTAGPRLAHSTARFALIRPVPLSRCGTWTTCSSDGSSCRSRRGVQSRGRDPPSTRNKIAAAQQSGEPAVGSGLTGGESERASDYGISKIERHSAQGPRPDRALLGASGGPFG